MEAKRIEKALESAKANLSVARYNNTPGDVAYWEKEVARLEATKPGKDAPVPEEAPKAAPKAPKAKAPKAPKKGGGR